MESFRPGWLKRSFYQISFVHRVPSVVYLLLQDAHAGYLRKDKAFVVEMSTELELVSDLFARKKH